MEKLRRRDNSNMGAEKSTEDGNKRQKKIQKREGKQNKGWKNRNARKKKMQGKAAR